MYAVWLCYVLIRFTFKFQDASVSKLPSASKTQAMYPIGTQSCLRRPPSSLPAFTGQTEQGKLERWHVGLSSELRYDLVTAGYWHITPERMQKGVYSPYGFLDSTFLGSLHSSRCFHTSALSRGLDLQTVLSPTCLVVAQALVGRDTRG